MGTVLSTVIPCMGKLPDVDLQVSNNQARCRSNCCDKHQLHIIVNNEKEKAFIIELINLSKKNIIEQNTELPKIIKTLSDKGQGQK